MNIGSEIMVVNEFRNRVMDTYMVLILWVEIKNGSPCGLPLDFIYYSLVFQFVPLYYLPF